MFYLYKITNLTNNKLYIGQTVQPKKRWYQHRFIAATPKMPISHAIKKYGASNFEFETIACCKNQDDANWTESELIKQYNSFIEYGGYNATYGGMNAPKTEEWKKKVSQAMFGKYKGKKLSDEHKLKMREAHLGKKHSELSKSKMRKPRSEEHKKHISEGRKGIMFSEEHKHNLSEAHKKNKETK